MNQIERVARAICTACEENPDHTGDARGNAFRWQDYADVAQAAIDAVDRWEPIESAPHDTDVLLYCPLRHETNPERIEIGKATRGERTSIKSTYSSHAWATHCMPLPEPPK
jgi:hypothetical protein